MLHERRTHPRLIHLFEMLTVDDPGSPHLDGAVVLVMELAADALGNVLRGHAGRPLPDAPRLITEICEGLAHMHASGWVHGDLKPSNVLIMTDGSVRLADFGLATELEGTHGYLPPTGSTEYMPAERWSEPLGERGAAIRMTGGHLGLRRHRVPGAHGSPAVPRCHGPGSRRRGSRVRRRPTGAHALPDLVARVAGLRGRLPETGPPAAGVP
ncbi:MAG: protein kinase domain-containing protein [Egibacteraceae bacterium]